MREKLPDFFFSFLHSLFFFVISSALARALYASSANLFRLRSLCIDFYHLLYYYIVSTYMGNGKSAYMH